MVKPDNFRKSLCVKFSVIPEKFSFAPFVLPPASPRTCCGAQSWQTPNLVVVALDPGRVRDDEIGECGLESSSYGLGYNLTVFA